MVLVVSVEYDERVVLVQCGDVLPPGLEGGGVGDNIAVEAPVVVRLDYGVGALARDIVDVLGESVCLHIVPFALTGCGCKGCCRTHSSQVANVERVQWPS